MITSERYIALLLFSLLVILVCSGHNIPTIAYGTYGNGWKYDGYGNIKSDPSRGVTSQHLEELKTKHNTINKHYAKNNIITCSINEH